MEKFERQTHRTSRALEYFSEKEITMQVGVPRESWPLAITKELIDNALDACENAGIPPEIDVAIEDKCISIKDNGPGLPVDTIDSSLDYMYRVSDKSHYVSPSRGQLGNALKCVYAIPYIVDGKCGKVDITTGGQKHRIEVRLNLLSQEPEISHTVEDAFIKNGTLMEMHSNLLTSLAEVYEVHDFYKRATELVSHYAAFNPHATFNYSYHTDYIQDEDEDFIPQDYKVKYNRTVEQFEKWKPCDKIPAHWYTAEQLRNLIAAHVHGEGNGGRVRTVRDFVSEFRGFTGPGKQKKVTNSLGLEKGTYLHDFVDKGDVDIEMVKSLHSHMKVNCNAPKPKALGIIGKEHFTHWVIEQGIEESTINYSMEYGEHGDLPFVLEVAFGIFNNKESGRKMVNGLNWAPTITDPLRLIGQYSAEAQIERDDPVLLLIHIAHPQLKFTGKEKGEIELCYIMEEKLSKAIKKVTKDFTAEKRKVARESHLSRSAYTRISYNEPETTVKEAAFQIMEEAYMKASSDNTLPTKARQIMYAARPLVCKLVNKPFTSRYLQNQIEPFMDAYPELTADWDVIYDARGTLLEPHTEKRVDLGTLEVRNYIKKWKRQLEVFDGYGYVIPHKVETIGPNNRYKNVLFVEKEGFNELFRHVNLAARYDIAIMSTKGLSVTAARHLVDKLSRQGVRIFVMHDFDKSGFAIVHTLGHNTDRWRYATPPNVIDLGFRLKDIQGLETEEVEYKTRKDPRIKLREYGATEEEMAILVASEGTWKDFHGERVELNAMTSRQFIDWVEMKLEEHGVEKLIPDDDALKQVYRNAHKIAYINQNREKIIDSYKGDRLVIPDNLHALVERRLNDSDDMPWDEAIWLECLGSTEEAK